MDSPDSGLLDDWSSSRACSVPRFAHSMCDLSSAQSSRIKQFPVPGFIERGLDYYARRLYRASGFAAVANLLS